MRLALIGACVRLHLPGFLGGSVTCDKWNTNSTFGTLSLLYEPNSEEHLRMSEGGRRLWQGLI